MKTTERTAQQKKVFRAYDLHCDFCETCASYEQGDNTDPCYAGQVLWSCFYGIPYPVSEEDFLIIFGDGSPAPTGVLKATSGYRASGK